MNDLHTIQKKNADAVRANIPAELAKGLFVLEHRSGLHFVDYSTHLTEKEANAKALELVEKDPTATSQLHYPSARD